MESPDSVEQLPLNLSNWLSTRVALSWEPMAEEERIGNVAQHCNMRDLDNSEEQVEGDMWCQHQWQAPAKDRRDAALGTSS